jgi:nicotinamide-nucleotide amidase
MNDIRRPEDDQGQDDIRRLAEIAQHRGIRVAVAESLTCGLLASEVGKGQNAAEWFAGGVVAYLYDIKQNVLGVAPNLDPCSPGCAEQLAVGVRDLMNADVAVSTTGVGGPDPSDGHPPGTVYLGWADPTGVGHLRLNLGDHPEEVLPAAVDAAIRLLADTVEKSEHAGETP